MKTKLDDLVSGSPLVSYLSDFKVEFFSLLSLERKDKINSLVLNSKEGEENTDKLDKRKYGKTIAFVKSNNLPNGVTLNYDMIFVFLPSSNSVKNSIPCQIYWSFQQIKNSLE